MVSLALSLAPKEPYGTPRLPEAGGAGTESLGAGGCRVTAFLHLPPGEAEQSAPRPEWVETERDVDSKQGDSAEGGGHAGRGGQVGGESGATVQAGGAPAGRPAPQLAGPHPQHGRPRNDRQRRPEEGALPAARRLMRIDRSPGSTRGHQLPAGGATAH